jgi:hypothetical protein
MDPEEDKDKEMAFQNAKRDMNAVYGLSDSDSSDNEHHKALHVMFGGSWDITYWRIIKTLRWEVAAAAPSPRAVLHHKWMATLISFDASDLPKSMAGAGQLPLIVSPTITNNKMYHVLIDGGAALDLISLAAFKKLQILMSKLQPSCPFFGVGPVSVMPCNYISLPVTFGMNFWMESILFDVTKVNLPFNAILGRPTLYQFMAVTHYGYLVLKMPSLNGVIKIHEDRDAGVSTLEKLQALAASYEAATGPKRQDPTLLSSW